LDQKPRCAPKSSLAELVSETRVSGEEPAAKVGDRAGEALDLRRVRVDVEQLDAPFELAAHPKRPGRQ
jgi:hypothetical protein